MEEDKQQQKEQQHEEKKEAEQVASQPPVNTDSLKLQQQHQNEAKSQKSPQSQTKPQQSPTVEKNTDAIKHTQQQGFERIKKPVSLQHYAIDKITFPGDNVVCQNISIAVTGTITKGGTLTKHTAYHIVGADQKGPFEIYRRYSEFDALRSLLVERWPGCFIPVLPDKSIVSKNSEEVVHRRERQLSDFLQKIAWHTHLYRSEQFQIFLKSGESDVSTTLQKMQKAVDLDEIVNRYSTLFKDILNKDTTSASAVRVSTFRTALRKILQQVGQLEQAAINMAEGKDELNKKLPLLLNIINRYQRNTVLQFCSPNHPKLVYLNQSNSQLAKHSALLTEATKNNPYWYFSDLVTVQLKQSQAFLDAIEMTEVFTKKRMDCQTQIKSLEQQIEELALGKSTISSMTTRKSKQQVKFLLGEKNKKLIHQKHNYMTLADMVQGLLGNQQIQSFKNMKKRYYKSILRKTARSQAHFALSLRKLWHDIAEATQSGQGSAVLSTGSKVTGASDNPEPKLSEG